MTKKLRIFFGNIGYATGINGCLRHHLLYFHRHFYCPIGTQEKVLAQLNLLIEKENPDLCCFVEIDKEQNHLNFLAQKNYPFFDVENKYGEKSFLRDFAPTKGKSNGFMAKEKFEYEKIFFDSGVKKLIYKIQLRENLTLFFSHFSLKKPTREKQLQQVREIFSQTKGEIIFLGDFNILKGLEELEPLLHDNLILLNDKTKPTFTFHKSSLLLDLCLCTKGILPFLKLEIHPQPYSDHAALVVEITV
ncbi:MAG: endonuclease/exonuclease/phosphatase family protein [Pseudomonadota bacterium]